MNDATLVQEAVGGDVRAFTAIFDTHAPQVHDLALAILRDRKAAGEVLHSTFTDAGERLESLKEPERLRVWLLAITRFHARLAGDESGLDRQPAGTDHLAERAQLAGLVWEATADLPMRERALFDLHLRQRLEGEDLADGLGVTSDEVGELRTWMSGTEKGLAGYILMRRAGGECPDLPLLLRGWDGRFTPLISSHIANHVDVCRVCRETGAALPSPFALYASAPQAPLPRVDTSVPTATPGEPSTKASS